MTSADLLIGKRAVSVILFYFHRMELRLNKYGMCLPLLFGKKEHRV